MRRRFQSYLFVLLVGALAVPALAQTTTATIRGKVTIEGGAALPNAQIHAVGTASGFTKVITTGETGFFQLGGLTPGEYKIDITAEGFDSYKETVRVLVGQNLDLNVVLKPGAVSESITVIGEQAVETRTSEAATNVTTRQIENLPQDSRNFLNFATLAPGIRLSTDPLKKTIAADAQPSEQTNVFIDGVSFKNDVLQGGLVGQDSSRGNPFPQNAVQEFRVVTQNYSAQYDKAASAIITAVTKSGGNDIQGQAFWFYQPKQWVSATPKNFQFSTLTSNSDYKRSQPGISIGGPIVKDKLHYFLSYEGDDEHATTGVSVGNSLYAQQFAAYQGNFPSPFKSNLGFGKLSWQPAENQLVDWSGNYRKENEVRDFGSQTSFQAAHDIRNQVNGSTVRYQWNNNDTLNEATLSYQDYNWHQAAKDSTDVGLNYAGVIRIGGADTTQNFDQRRLELRDDYSFSVANWGGQHSFQVGGNFDSLRYDVHKDQTGNPVFNFKNDPANGFSFDQPYEAQFGFGNPALAVSNQQYGIFAQDTWAVNSRLTFNLGLRYDYESKELDSGYVTPANIVTALTGKVDSSYFSTGNSRPAYKGEIQPRLGFSYDLTGNASTVAFGGVGRFYDRLFLNATLDERYRLQFPVYRIEFSPDGRPGTIKWDPKYLSVAGLNGLIASGATNPEIYLLNNNTKPPYSNAWNLGVRHSFGKWNGSVSYDGVRGYRGFTWLSASGLCCAALVPGYGNVIISDPKGKDYKYNALFLTVDRPYSGSWGAHLAWTHAKATQNGNDLFSLDYPSAAAYPEHEVPGTERDRIVANVLFGNLPWDLRFGASLSFGTGGATNVLDFSQGFDLPAREQTLPFKNSIRPPTTWGFADRTIDFRLEKNFRVAGNFSLGIVGEVFNAFNWANYGCLNNFIPPEGNPTFGQPTCVVGLGRREQVGVKINF
jgi:outer membrane receptor protein involved in Fe transport